MPLHPRSPHKADAHHLTSSACTFHTRSCSSSLSDLTCFFHLLLHSCLGPLPFTVTLYARAVKGLLASESSNQPICPEIFENFLPSQAPKSSHQAATVSKGKHPYPKPASSEYTSPPTPCPPSQSSSSPHGRSIRAGDIAPELELTHFITRHQMQCRPQQPSMPSGSKSSRNA